MQQQVALCPYGCFVRYGGAAALSGTKGSGQSSRILSSLTFGCFAAQSAAPGGQDGNASCLRLAVTDVFMSI